MCFVNNAKQPQIPPRTGYSATDRAHLLILPLLVIGLGCCANFDADWRQAEVPALVPFADVFARPDTIRRDPDSLVGELTALDVDHEGRNAHHGALCGLLVCGAPGKTAGFYPRGG